MKLLNCARTKVLLVVFVAAIVFGSGIARADFTMSEPVNLGPVINDSYDTQECDFSHDGLQLYFAVWNRPDGYGYDDLYVSERETLNSPWQEPVNLGPNVNSSGLEEQPSISGDGLELYFSCREDYILRVCTRASKDAPWDSPVKIGPPVGSNEPAMEIGSNDAWGPDISADGLELYFQSNRGGGYGSSDIWVTKRATKDDPWGEPVNLGPNVNTSANDGSPCISTDGLTLVFGETSDMRASTRRSTNEEWEPAVKLNISFPCKFFGPTLSPDNSTLYFNGSMTCGEYGYGAGDFWQVEFIPIVDFNSDEIVDLADLLIMIDNWDTDNSLCDIGPMPWGDGVVDIEDLKIFIKYWEQENMPQTTENGE